MNYEVRAGLWADIESMDLRNHGFVEPEDWDKIYQLAEEQSVVGVGLTGIERYKYLNADLNLKYSARDTVAVEM